MSVTVPVFPLPNVVFFPDTWLPLRIFEPRYRRMLSDALEGERLIVIALAREERPPGPPPSVHRIGTIGRIEIVEPGQEGRAKILLRGLARARVGRMREKPGGYYATEPEVIVETVPDIQDPRVAKRRAAFLLTARRYAEQVLEDRYAEDFIHDALPLATGINRAATWLRTSVEEKQRLLEIHDLATRARAVEETMNRQIQAHLAATRFESRRPEEPRVN